MAINAVFQVVLASPSGDGAGTTVDLNVQMPFTGITLGHKTVAITGPFNGSIEIQTSPDETNWYPLKALGQTDPVVFVPGGRKSFEVLSLMRYVRTRRFGGASSEPGLFGVCISSDRHVHYEDMTAPP